jgi:putative surface-exposed virulence protein
MSRALGLSLVLLSLVVAFGLPLAADSVDPVWEDETSLDDVEQAGEALVDGVQASGDAAVRYARSNTPASVGGVADAAGSAATDAVAAVDAGAPGSADETITNDNDVVDPDANDNGLSDGTTRTGCNGTVDPAGNDDVINDGDVIDLDINGNFLLDNANDSACYGTVDKAGDRDTINDNDVADADVNNNAGVDNGSESGCYGTFDEAGDGDIINDGDVADADVYDNALQDESDDEGCYGTIDGAGDGDTINDNDVVDADVGQNGLQDNGNDSGSYGTIDEGGDEDTINDNDVVDADVHDNPLFENSDDNGTYGTAARSQADEAGDVYYQIDFIEAPVIEDFGPAGTDNFYFNQNRLFQAVVLSSQGGDRTDDLNYESAKAESSPDCILDGEQDTSSIEFDSSTQQATITFSVSPQCVGEDIEVAMAGYCLPEGEKRVQSEEDVSRQNLTAFTTRNVSASDGAVTLRIDLNDDPKVDSDCAPSADGSDGDTINDNDVADADANDNALQDNGNSSGYYGTTDEGGENDTVNDNDVVDADANGNAVDDREGDDATYGTTADGENCQVNDNDGADADANNNTVIRTGNGSRGDDSGQDENDTSDEDVIWVRLEDNSITDGESGNNDAGIDPRNAQGSNESAERNDNDVVDADVNNNTVINAAGGQEGSFQLLSGESDYDLKYIGPNGRITLLHWSDVEVVDQEDS